MRFNRKSARGNEYEKRLQSSIVSLLVWDNYEVVRFNSGAAEYESRRKGEDKDTRRVIRFYTWFGRLGQKKSSGVPDLLVVGHGDLFWIEVKTADGDIKPQQQRFADMCTANGIGHLFARSIDDVTAFVKQRRGGTSGIK